MLFRPSCVLPRYCGLIAVSFAIVGSQSVVLGEDTPGLWNRFRGNNGRGVVSTCRVPLPWKKSDVAWEIRPPGIGNGSPMVHGDRIFLMSADPDSAERYLLAYHRRTGKELWRKTYPSQPHHLHSRSSYASCTPCVSAEAVYFTWATPGNVVLMALSHSGEKLWSKDLGPYVSQHGYGASPALIGNKVILFNSQQADQLRPGMQPGESRVTAFDAATGEVIWKTPRTTTRACYGLPALFRDTSGEEALLFSNTGDGLFALSLETGKPLWNKKVFAKRCVSCPLVVGDLAIGTEGSGGGGNILYAVDLKGNHDVKIKIIRSAPYVPTPVASGDLLFLWDDRGIVTCVRLPSGEVVWSNRISGNVSTSPVIAGDKVLGIAEDGTVTILAASEAFRELGSIKLGDTTRATPFVADDYLLLRTNSKLICVGKP